MKPKGRMRVGELEARTGATRDQIHNYVELGLVAEPEREGRTTMWYGPAHIEAIEKILALRQHDLPLSRIRELMAKLPNAPVETLKTIGALVVPDERAGWPATTEPSPAATMVLSSLGLGTEDLDTAVVTAAEEISQLPLGERQIAVGLGHAMGASLDAIRPGLQGVITHALVDPREKITESVESLRHARQVARKLFEAVWVQNERRLTARVLEELYGRAQSAERARFLPLANEAFEGGTLRRVLLDKRVEDGDPTGHVERLELAFNLSSARELGRLAEQAHTAGVKSPWVAFSRGVSKLDTGRWDDAAAQFAHALREEPCWSLAKVFEVTARSLSLARRGDFLAALSLAATLREENYRERTPEHPNEVLALRELLVRAQTLGAVVGEERSARELCEKLLQTTAKIVRDDPRRGSGAIDRIEGNALIFYADSLHSAGETQRARELLAVAQNFDGAIGRAARARLSRYR